MSESDRNEILGRLTRALEPVRAKGASPYPEYDTGIMRAEVRVTEGGGWEDFARNLKKVNGRSMTSIEELITFLGEQNATEGYCDPRLWPLFESTFPSEWKIHRQYQRKLLDICSFGITECAGIIAETGTIILNDTLTPNRLGALAPWIHIAVLPGDRPIYPTVADAIAGQDKDPNIIWVTGPSKTADVEGILIEGVHGPGEQVCLRLG